MGVNLTQSSTISKPISVARRFFLVSGPAGSSFFRGSHISMSDKIPHPPILPIWRDPRFIVGCLLLAIAFFAAGCAPLVSTQYDKVNFEEKKLDLAVRASGPTFDQADEMWLTANDNLDLIFGWKEVTIKMRDDEQASCPSYPGTGCHLCTVCDPKCEGSRDALIFDQTPVFATLKKTDPLGQTVTVREIAIPPGGCLHNGIPPPPPVRVEDKMTYTFVNQVLAPDETNAPSMLSLKVRVIGQPTHFRIDLKQDTVHARPNTTLFTGTVPLPDGHLPVNFSNSFRVSHIRVLSGMADPVTGATGEPRQLPNIQPWRVIWLVNYQGRNIRDNEESACFFNPQDPEADLDMNTCRETPEDTMPHVEELTPTVYLHDPRPFLVWAIEYVPGQTGPETPDFAGGFPVLDLEIH